MTFEQMNRQRDRLRKEAVKALNSLVVHRGNAVPGVFGLTQVDRAGEWECVDNPLNRRERCRVTMLTTDGDDGVTVTAVGNDLGEDVTVEADKLNVDDLLSLVQAVEKVAVPTA